MTDQHLRKVAEELLPCPFCGGEELAMRKTEYGRPVMKWVKCETCEATSTSYTGSEDARAAWNTRAPDPRAEAAEGELNRRDAVAQEAWGDQRDEYSDLILAAHPANSGDHDTFAQALAMVGKRHGKYELVGAMNWLLSRALAAEAKVSALTERVGWQPIETAPFDPEWSILGWEPGMDAAIEIAWRVDMGRWLSRGGANISPTHWRPLPEPPLLPQQKGSGE